MTGKDIHVDFMSTDMIQRLNQLTNPRPEYAPFPGKIANSGEEIQALYVHVPFCTTKCHYCDFYSIAGHIDQADAFLDALEIEAGLWRTRLGTIAPETIFIGGGTPTLLDPARLARLLRIIASNINGARLAEFSIEANPNTFDAERAAVLVQAGVNRISFGAQSFMASELRTLQRDHDPENVPKAFDLARAAGIDNINVDLIFGIPGQTLESWDYSLSRALGLSGERGPDHMSCYSLIYEPNTAMTARMNKGEFAPIDEELELAMFDHVHGRMKSAGFTRYEISNYARRGKQCGHNIHYWKGANWLAWGPAAAGHINGHRWKNVASLTHYLDALSVRSSGFSLSSPQAKACTPNPSATLPLTQFEHLSARAWAGEVAVFWLRLSEGLNYGEFQARTHVDARPILEPALEMYASMGFVELLPGVIRLTEKAVPVSNRLLAAALAAFSGAGVMYPK